LLSPIRDIKQAAAHWVAPFDSKLPLQERSEARRKSVAFLRILSQLRQWHEVFRMTRHFDDDYEIAQAQLSLYEPLGLEGFVKAESIVRIFDSLNVGS
jgi:hypothetical protein